ncbi:hypothetical protein C2E25_05505 [Geothermobacter hydrogeniphilus]|uniref:Formylglycine-generating enzyme, required for sulfatase activity, contains SUMF1/FGE domain n=1 Tax=Geothermobacter hydrogeniphilus TaxID=1969733 RepID=A0A2K2HC69_9BACT|nr:SUMF1/EgtB/PvdO family nonheme iron enzyme [Geothermobacter hydrogeniphilus]PNU20841.1 hypothetical protein C2E25_05505 [Geothermobacter hydrogeniphilus]
MSRLIEIHAPNQEPKLAETELPLVVGTGPDADIRLPGDTGVLAQVGESDGHLYLQPVETAGGLFHNDEPLRASVWLKSGDISRCGESLIHWRISGQRLQVVISRIDASATDPPVVSPPLSVGAGTNVEIPLPPPSPVRRSPRRLRAVLAGLFGVLLAVALFVLAAVPFQVEVTPAPESLDISGFPPVVRFGVGYLGIPGSYRLHAEKQGYRPLDESIEIRRDRRYRFALERLPGVVRIVSHPPGVTVRVDGTLVGTTPLAGIEIPPGEHLLRFEHPRYRSREEKLLVAGGGERQGLRVDLQPAWARVHLRTEPSGAMVRVDGRPRGRTPLELELIEGQRKLEFAEEQFIPLEATLVVEAGRDLAPPVYRLQPAPASVSLNSVPNGVTVAVDGRFAGRTPLTLSLESGRKHALRLTAAGYRTRVVRMQFEAAEKRVLDIRLEPEYGVVFINADPPDAELFIDGRKQQRSVGRFRLTTRSHKLELRAAGYRNLTREVTPNSAYSQRVDLTLSRKGPSAGTAGASLSSRIKTALGQELILVRPAPFQMGASRREAGRRANERQHQVTLKRPFYIAVREVTNQEFRRFMAAHNSGMFRGRSLDGDDHPVVNLSWEDAARFLNWLSKKDGLPPYYREENGRLGAAQPRGGGYRLPSEAEWAYAARMAGRRQPARYPWSGRYPPTTPAGNFADASARSLLPVVLEHYRDNFPLTAPVGSFPANPAGLRDLGGNVAEWCHDYYAVQPTAPSGGDVDPLGPEAGAHHVVRGSSWRDAGITELRFSYRRYSRKPEDDIGFRFVRYAR